MEHKEQWANEVFATIEGMKRAKPSNDVFTRINKQLQNSVQVKIIPLNKLGWAAAAACIMITLNVFAFTTGVKGGNQTFASKDQLLTDFTLYK